MTRADAPLPDRRTSLGMLGAAAFFGIAARAPQPAARRGPGVAFSWEGLQLLAERTAGAPWRQVKPVPAAVPIDFDAVGRISFDAGHALWRGAGDQETRFFPLSRYANTPVDIAVVEGGKAYPFAFAPELFDIAAGTPGHNAPITLAPGFAGFRLMNANGRGDWMAYQGASYFRSAGALDQYGLSARGLAIDTGIDGKEEFPLFTRFWLERGASGAVTVYALLDGRSVAGAYRFVTRKTAAGPVQDVSAVIHLRKDVARLGIAPLTSMFWYGEGSRAAGTDWRPEIHDSDGLALLTGTGERVWRPLRNPPGPTINSFSDRAPKGFGLLQRDRVFDHYQDDGAFYEKRPNLWVEPKGDWGAGAVMLYEIPTRGETDDNIVAFWVSAEPAKAGSRRSFDYRLSWNAVEPVPSATARVTDCWTGTAGRPGREPIAGARRLVADFTGMSLAGLGRGDDVQAEVAVTHGTAIATHAYPVVGVPDCWRLIVDVARNDGQPSDLRVYLRRGQDALSETLLYQLA